MLALSVQSGDEFSPWDEIESIPNWSLVENWEGHHNHETCPGCALCDVWELPPRNTTATVVERLAAR